jgi:hypothetical protein
VNAEKDANSRGLVTEDRESNREQKGKITNNNLDTFNIPTLSETRVMVLGVQPQGRPASSPSEWFNGLPPITRIWFSCVAGTTLAMTMKMINPYLLLLDYTAAFKHLQVADAS